MKRNLLRCLLFAAALVLCVAPALAACSAPASAPGATVAAPAATATAQPTEAPAEAPKVELTVLAASSLTESFTQLGKNFEAAHPDIKVAFSFAGSQDLVAQITSGVKADVFASASKSYMDALVEKGLVDKDAAKTFAGNKLVVVCRKDLSPMPAFADLGSKKLLLVIADETVPVGKYTLTMLDKVEKAGAIPGFKEKFLANVVSKETNVKLVLQKVVLGEADCGIVYTTDALTADQTKIATVAVPDEYNVPASYPAAALLGSAHPSEAKQFMYYILSDAGQATFQKFGFTKP